MGSLLLIFGDCPSKHPSAMTLSRVVRCDERDQLPDEMKRMGGSLTELGLLLRILQIQRLVGVQKSNDQKV